ncbi:hypothetical protein FHS09_003656 [Microbulbifer rhizosphaerae]|uniref:Uncharacterized protein n=1 Tax=Microbulbifer rhizosphaerae TaxID=1562603 RepID=A0A7W4WEJ4_9GAMM|nr:hypothetical protein [Microbulbifer rhizosphaerae]
MSELMRWYPVLWRLGSGVSFAALASRRNDEGVVGCSLVSGLECGGVGF